MRKLQLMATVAITLCYSVTSQATFNITWGATETGTALYGSDDVRLSGLAGYRAELILDADNDTVLADMIAAKQFGINTETAYGGLYNAALLDDDVVIAAGSWQEGGTADSLYFAGLLAFGDVFSPYSSPTDSANTSMNLYIRWFDTTDGAAASDVGIIYGTTGWKTTANPTLAGESLDFTYGGTGGSDGGGLSGSAYTGGSVDGWQVVAPVPEPGSMVLFALGLVTLAVRRRRR